MRETQFRGSKVKIAPDKVFWLIKGQSQDREYKIAIFEPPRGLAPYQRSNNTIHQVAALDHMEYFFDFQL